jgi:aminoglycoside phosphotransferase (APT) family kinase protein
LGSDTGDDPVDAILARHGVRGPWESLRATGIANRIYATRDVILRVATDHPQACADARTESVAAPVARAAGIKVPRLLAFDDSRTLVDRPYSLWERVHGETLGLFVSDPRLAPATWRAVGYELATLHSRVHECPDALGWLDRPERDMTLADRLAALTRRSRIETSLAGEIETWIGAIEPVIIATATPICFLHNDVHDMNLICARNGSLRALIDWGDAGWGDPVLEFAQVPLSAMPFVLEGYRAEAATLLDDRAGARVIWDKLAHLLEVLEDPPSRPAPLEELRRYIRATGLP